MDPVISVVVPVYKGIRFLREALESLMAQTFCDWECICVDDGSKDGSGALADRLAEVDGRIRVIHQANGGTSVARNTALETVRGLYVAFLDEDDVYHPRYLETLHAAATATGADFVGCDFTAFPEDRLPDFQDVPPPSTDWRTYDCAGLAELVSDYYQGVPFEIWRNLYRADVIRGHEFAPGVRVEQDLRWLYTLLPRVRKYVRLPWAGYAWRTNSIGGYLNQDAKSLLSLAQTSRLVLDAIPDGLCLTPMQRERFAWAMSRDLNWNIRRNLINRTAKIGWMDRWRLIGRLRKLLPYGVDIRRCIRHPHRLMEWNVFMATGLTFRMRPDRDIGG